MPSINLENMKTVWVTDRPWTSPDGKVTIWSIKLEDPAGERGDYSTMSKHIAELGWSGDIELYTNDKGKEYVRQLKKDEPKGFAGKSDTQYLKDLSDMPLRVYTATIGYVDATGLMKDKAYLGNFMSYIQAVSEDLLRMSDNIRASESKAATDVLGKAERQDVGEPDLPPGF